MNKTSVEIARQVSIDGLFSQLCEQLPYGHYIDIHLEPGSMHASLSNFRCSDIESGPDVEENAADCLMRLLAVALIEGKR